MKNNIVNFKQAELKITKDNWFVQYYIVNPLTNILMRKTIRLNHIKSITSRRQYANVLY